MRQNLLAKYASSNSKVFADLLSEYEIDHFDEEVFRRELKESDMLDFIFERCQVMFELHHDWHNEHWGGEELDYMRFYLIKHHSLYISITDSMISDEMETIVKIFKELPVRHCFETCTSLFELLDLFLSISIDLKNDNLKDWERINPHIDVTWTIDLLTYLNSNGFDVTNFNETQQRLNAYNEH